MERRCWLTVVRFWLKKGEAENVNPINYSLFLNSKSICFYAARIVYWGKNKEP
tara:strand:- start:98 stop:256 length:159 start_codon:yes stop_codon:yes gene_type:complete